MIKPITFQGTVNFKASLYALEIRSRFINQDEAHGYFKNYGDDLKYISNSTNSITIGTGAFLINGRMNEVTSQETVPVIVTPNSKGYILAIIETYHLNDENNCRFEARTSASWDELDRSLTQQDTYAFDADSNNKIFEYPIFKFEINSSGSIINVSQLLAPIADYQKVFTQMLEAERNSDVALDKANNAQTLANEARGLAAVATDVANVAIATANQADMKANNALNIASAADTTADRAIAKVEKLETDIGDKMGTTVKIDGTAQNEWDATDVMKSSDTFHFNGGGA